MKRFSSVIVCLLVLCGATYLGFAQTKKGKVKSAKAELRNAQGEVIASATLTEVKGGVRISLNVAKMAAGSHAFHLHSVGQCEAPAFTSAGPHFNPENKKHGLKNPEGWHAGDLPNITVAANGKGKATILAKGMTLNEGANSLFKEGGTALVIHEKADDDLTDPAGNAGPRIACGVIMK